MLKQTINILEQQKVAPRIMLLPRLIISNSYPATKSTTCVSEVPKFDWNPIKYNFNFELLQREYASYCQKYNVVNKFEKQRQALQASIEEQEANAAVSANKAIQRCYIQTVVFGSSLSEPSLSSLDESDENTVHDMAGKRAKQAKKKRSKRRNGGHQSIRC